ncbi:MAG: hypothetical protein ACRDRX_04510 [Pseudonocardiaceae bacterium]
MSRRRDPCPTCGRCRSVPGALLAALLVALSPMLGALAASWWVWWWLPALILTGWTLAAVLLVHGLTAAARGSHRHRLRRVKAATRS